MARYTIVPRAGNEGFDVKVVSAIGGSHTILGFGTEAEAKAWIERDKRHEMLTAPVIPSVIEVANQPPG